MTAKDPVRVIKECPLCETIHYGERALSGHALYSHFKRTCPLCKTKLRTNLYDHITQEHPGADISTAFHAFLLGVTP